MDNIVQIKNLTDKALLTIEGENGIYLIGLDTNGLIKVASVEGTADRFSDLPAGIVVPLLRLTKCKEGGLMLTSHNKDVTCLVNKEKLNTEINLLGGSTIEVAEKKLRVFIGPMAKERRLLPRTPGLTVSKMPPPKPGRTGNSIPALPTKENTDWCHVYHPSLDEELLQHSTSPKQLGDLAASFLTKQIHMYTDSRLSAKLTDQIFKFMQEAAEFQGDILMNYVKEITQHLDEMPEAERDKPMHAPSIKLLVELLRQIMDPMSDVVLCLQLLRKFSHFPQNLAVMMKCQAAAAVMGCMAVYLNQQEVQLNSLDILAKITTYQYQVNEKVQIRETGLEMILRAMQHHDDHEHILQAGCRTLANLTTTLQTTLDQWLDFPYNYNEEVEEGINQYESLLKHIFSNASAVVQKILQGNSDNFGIRTEGRRFLFNLSKMSQILTKNAKRKLAEVDEEEFDQERSMEESFRPAVLAKKDSDDVESKSILRQGDKSTGLRKVHFVDELSFTMSTCSTVSTCSEVSDDGEEDVVRRKQTSGAVIEITESRKMTNSEIQNLQRISDELEGQTILQSTTDSQSDINVIESSAKTKENQDTDGDLEKSDDLQHSVESSELNDSSTHRRQCSPDDDGFEDHYEDLPEMRTGKNVKKRYGNLCDSLDQPKVELLGTDQRHVEEGDDGQARDLPKSFSVSDVAVLTDVIRLKVIEYVSCLVYTGNDKQALKDIDLPLLDLLEKSQASPELIRYVQQQYSPSKTLLDIDTSYLIGIVDAVRYMSLLSDLLRKALLDVVVGMARNGDQLVLYIGLEVVKSVFGQETLISIVTDESFLRSLLSQVNVGTDDQSLLGDLHRLISDHQDTSLC